MEARRKSFLKVTSRRVLLLIVAFVLVFGIAGFACLKASEDPKFCANCHVISPYYDSWQQGDLYAAKHAKAGVVCLDCHESTLLGKANEGFKYVTGSYEEPLPKMDMPNEKCLSCHQREEFVNKVVFSGKYNPHDSHLTKDSETCASCHTMHQKSRISCGECHSQSWANPSNDTWGKKK